MKRLEDIPKENIYQVPEGYFERLPQKVQARIESSHPKHLSIRWGMALRLAIPIVAFAAVGIFWWQSNRTIEDQLGTIELDQLAYYLEDSDFTTEELAETVIWSTDDLTELEEHVFSTLETTSDEWGDLLEEYDLNVENF